MMTIVAVHAWKLSIIAYIAEPSVCSRCTSLVTKPCKKPSTSEPLRWTRDRCSSFWHETKPALLWLCLTNKLGWWQGKSEAARQVKLEQRRWNSSHWWSLNNGQNAFLKTAAQRSITILKKNGRPANQIIHKYKVIYHYLTIES